MKRKNEIHWYVSVRYALHKLKVTVWYFVRTGWHYMDYWDYKKTHNLTWNEENLDLWSVEIICVLFVKSRKE